MQQAVFEQEEHEGVKRGAAGGQEVRRAKSDARERGERTYCANENEETEHLRKHPTTKGHIKVPKPAPFKVHHNATHTCETSPLLVHHGVYHGAIIFVMAPTNFKAH